MQANEKHTTVEQALIQVKSVSAVLGEKHVLVGKLKAMVKGPLPSSPDDFQKRKWFEKKG